MRQAVSAKSFRFKEMSGEFPNSLFDLTAKVQILDISPLYIFLNG
jgi:hypothetical protein